MKPCERIGKNIQYNIEDDIIQVKKTKNNSN